MQHSLLLLAASLLLGTVTASANTYTAASNGDYNSGTTWVGGIAPSASVTNDIIDVPLGITVNLTQNVNITGALSSLNVDGALSANPGASLTIADAAVTGLGSMAMDSITIGTSQWQYNGGLSIPIITSNGFAFPSVSLGLIVDKLYLKSGIFDLNGGEIEIQGGTATIYVTGGTMLGGIFPTPYNLMYSGSTDVTTGDELQDGYYDNQFQNLEINMTGGAGVTLSKDLYLHHNMTLTEGRLRMNGHAIAMIDSADFLPGAGVIVGYPTSDFHFWNVANFPYTTGVRFATDSNTIHSMDADAGTNAKLATTLHLTGILNLLDGIVDIDTNEITLAGQNMMMSGDTNIGSNYGYLIVRGNGRLSMPVAAGTVGWFPVATPHYFAPVRLMPHAGNNSGVLSVGIRDSVYEDGFSGVALSATQPMLNTTWHISSANATNINLKIQLLWEPATGIMVNGFSEADSAYVAHYTNGGWDLHQAIPISVSQPVIMDSLSLDSITSLSPFSTFSHNAAIPNANPTAIPSVLSAHAISIYPNPATSVLTLNCTMPVTSVGVYAADGRLVKQVPVHDHTIPVAGLAPGIYYLRFTASEPLPVLQFTKQ